MESRVINFIERYCRHVKGELAGQLIKLEGWQKKIIYDIFETRRDDGTRVYRYAYIEVPRKNGKTSLSAGIALYMLLADGEQGAEVYSAAANKEQANIAFEIASQMVDQDAKMAEKCEVLRKAIYVPGTASTFKSLSKESKTKHGLNASCVIIDELHAHADRDLFDVLTTSTGSRKQPLVIIITTAGVKDESSIGWIMHEKARKVIQGLEKDESFYACIYGADLEDDIYDEEIIKKANPNYGISVKPEYNQDQLARIKTEPSYENSARQLFYNQWLGSYHNFISTKHWADCNLSPIPHLTGCVGGLDLAATSDFNALVLVFPGDILHVRPYFWIPQDTVNKRHNSTQLNSWIKEGFIEVTPGNVSDRRFIRQRVNELNEQFEIKEIVYDRWGATELVVSLQDEDGFICMEHGQGYKDMSPAMKETERVVLNMELNHAGNPVLAWMNDNLMFEQDPAGNV